MLRFESHNVAFDQPSEEKYKKKLFNDGISSNTYAQVCAGSILIGEAAHGSTCLQNPILALTTNGQPLQCARFAKSNHVFPTTRFGSTLELALSSERFGACPIMLLYCTCDFTNSKISSFL